MKRFLLGMSAALLVMSGCRSTLQKELYTPEAKNDKSYTAVGTETSNTPKVLLHIGDGYTISVPENGYRYEKDYEDGAIEETWEHKSHDDIKINVTTYKNSDEITARGLFLREHDDYIFEDLLGYPLCGTEKDGDTLWFNLYEENGNVYIVSLEYDKNTKEKVITELADIAGTFKLKDNSTNENGEAHEQICGYPTAEQLNK